MNISVARAVMGSPLHRALFGAALLLANEGGSTVAELAFQLGIPKSAIRRYTQAARDRRARSPRAFLVYAALIAGGCDHSQLEGDGLRVCLYCLETNRPDHPGLRRYPSTDPKPEKPEPPRAYAPGALKGGRS